VKKRGFGKKAFRINAVPRIPHFRATVDIAAFWVGGGWLAAGAL
jgi:hypothetical protein